MLPAVTSLRSTAVQILVYSVVLWGVTVLLTPVADLGAIYLGVALVTGAAFSGMSLALVRDPTPGRAMRLFGFSITYLTLLFTAMAVDVLVRSGLS
jgi:protoheme IX farnesyltransferase